MSTTERELIESIRNSKNPELAFEYALALIFANLQKPLPSEQQALACQVASS
jgi:hypothetical protein